MFEFKSLILKVLSCVPPLIHDSRSPCSLKVCACRLSSSVSFRNLRLILGHRSIIGHSSHYSRMTYRAYLPIGPGVSEFGLRFSSELVVRRVACSHVQEWYCGSRIGLMFSNCLMFSS